MYLWRSIKKLQLTSKNRFQVAKGWLSEDKNIDLMVDESTSHNRTSFQAYGKKPKECIDSKHTIGSFTSYGLTISLTLRTKIKNEVKYLTLDRNLIVDKYNEMIAWWELNHLKLDRWCWAKYTNTSSAKGIRTHYQFEIIIRKVYYGLNGSYTTAIGSYKVIECGPILWRVNYRDLNAKRHRLDWFSWSTMIVK